MNRLKAFCQRFGARTLAILNHAIPSPVSGSNHFTLGQYHEGEMDKKHIEQTCEEENPTHG